MGSLILEGLKMIFRRQPKSNLNFSFFDPAILIPTIYLVKSFINHRGFYNKQRKSLSVQ